MPALSVIKSKDLYLWGGAGDDGHSENIFSDEFIRMNKIATDANWNVSALFDGDQPKEQARVAKAIQKFNLRQFSTKNFSQAVKEAGSKTHNQKDQVLFIIDTHGGIDATSNGHLLACSENGDCDSGSLKQTIENLQSQSVEVGVVDFSCYAGQTLKLADDKTCVISGSSSNDVGFADFDLHFIDHLVPGHSLEQIYLDARTTNNLGRPRISTPAGLAAEAAIKNLASESFEDVDLDTMASAPQVCNDCNDTKLKKILNLSEEMMQKSGESLKSAKAYMKASAHYRRLFQQVKKTANRLLPYNEKVEVLRKDTAYSWIDLAEVKNKPDTKEAYKKKLELEKSSAEFRQMEKILKAYRKATNSEVDDNNHAESKLAEAALLTEKYENQLYLDLYKSYQGNEENPCAKFIF